MAYLFDRMRTLAASGSRQAAALLEKADDLDEALAKDPSDVTTVLGARATSASLMVRGDGGASQLRQLPEVLPQWQAIAGAG
jgi:hypothetical protein